MRDDEQHSNIIITCPSCHGQYRVNENDLGPNGRRVKCSSCGNYWKALPTALPLDQSAQTNAPSPQEEKLSRAMVERKRREAMNELALIAAPHEQFRHRQRLKHQRKLRLVAALPWGAGIVLCIVVAAIAWSRRDTIVVAWPKTGSLFAMLGQKTNRTGLEIEAVEIRRAYEGASPVLAVTGMVSNVSASKRQTMPLNISLHDATGKQMREQRLEPDEQTLAPGQQTPFALRIDAPPPEAETLKLRFHHDNAEKPHDKPVQDNTDHKPDTEH